MTIRATGDVGRTMAAVGAVPTYMSATEVRQAMGSGVVQTVASRRLHIMSSTMTTKPWRNGVLHWMSAASSGLHIPRRSFAAVSGASVATSAVFARIAIPEMLAEGYDKRFAAGVVAAAGTLASLIPPSAILVIYAIIVEQDVGRLLLAGFIPGAFSALICGGLVIGLALVFKDFDPPVGGFTWKQRFASLPGAFPIFFVVLIIILHLQPVWGRRMGHPDRRWRARGVCGFADCVVQRYAVAAA